MPIQINGIDLGQTLTATALQTLSQGTGNSFLTQIMQQLSQGSGNTASQGSGSAPSASGNTVSQANQGSAPSASSGLPSSQQTPIMNLQQSLTASGQPLQNFQVAAGNREPTAAGAGTVWLPPPGRDPDSGAFQQLRR